MLKLSPFLARVAGIIGIANPGMPEREGRVRFPVLRSRLALDLALLNFPSRKHVVPI